MNPIKNGIRQGNLVVPAGVRLLVGTQYPLVGTNNPGIELQGNGTGSLYVTGAPFGAGYIGTEAAGTRCMIDLRSSQGAIGAPTHSLSGDELGGVQIGGGASPDGSLIDVGTMTCFAGADFSASSTPTQWSFRAVPSGSTGKVIVWTVDGSGTVTMTGALSGATNMVDLSAIPDTTHNVTSTFGGLWGATTFTSPCGLSLRRANGTAGSPTGITSGQDVAQLVTYGTFDTSGSFRQSATMKVTATETWAAGVGGSKITFSVVANTTSAQATALTLDQDQSATFAGSVLAQKAIIFTPTTVTVTSNAGTVPITVSNAKLTNSSAATITVTIATASAVDGQEVRVRIYDATAASQTITWVNTENGKSSAPTTTLGSTTIPTWANFMFNSVSSKWTCVTV